MSFSTFLDLRISGAGERERSPPVIYLSRRYLHQSISDGVPENSGGVPNRRGSPEEFDPPEGFYGGILDQKTSRWKTTRHHVPAGTVADMRDIYICHVFVIVFVYISATVPAGTWWRVVFHLPVSYSGIPP